LRARKEDLLKTLKAWCERNRRIPARTAAFLLVLMSLAVVTMAFQAAAAPAAQSSTLETIGKGILAGIMAAIIGWAAQKKAADGTHEDFDLPQGIATAVVGALFGGFAAWRKIPLLDAENLPWVPFVIQGLENGLKAVFRNLKVSVVRALSTVQAGTGGGGNPTPPAQTPPPNP
jgi:hypothetical protein